MSAAGKEPLAERMRPRTLADYAGQEHLLGKNGSLRRVLDSGRIPSMILWGPPGVGKTTLANIIAATCKRPMFSLSAVHSGVKDVREAIDMAKDCGQAILFIDEIHRFNKAQQDSLLGAVEKGVVTLIGATTENPSFEVISPLLSRCQVYVLKPLTAADLLALIDRACRQDILLAQKKIVVQESGMLLHLAGGDARKLFNIVELVVQSESGDEVVFTDAKVKEYTQEKIALYDRDGEKHYDMASAFIKSIRGSDPNAALYWMARMIQGGEDAKFIARRLLIAAAEDIGNANPNALLLATSCFQAVTMVGYPECEIILSQTVTFLATSPKSNSAITSLHKAKELAARSDDLPVPLHLRNAPTGFMKQLGYGKEYQYAHDYADHFSEQEYLPTQLSGSRLFDPGDNQREQEMRTRLHKLWGKKYAYGER